jgi:hypothetical protein
MKKPRKLVTGFCAIVFAVQSGCATQPTPNFVESSDRAQFGILALATARFKPHIENDFWVRGKADGTLKGAGAGAGACAVGVWGGPVGILLAIACMPFGMVVGAIAGGVGAASLDQVKEAEGQISAELSALNVQLALREHAVKYAAENSIPLIVLDDAGPTAAEAAPHYQSLAERPFDTVIEISALELKAWSIGKKDLNFAFEISAFARLVRVRNNTVLDSFHIAYRSGLHSQQDWTEDGGKLLVVEFNQAYQKIAEQVLDEWFLVYRPAKADLAVQPVSSSSDEGFSVYRPANADLAVQPASSSSSEGGNTSTRKRFPVYVLLPISPEIRPRSIFSGPGLEVVKLDSLQPTFRWEEFPRTYDLPPDSASKISSVSYDFRIYDADHLNDRMVAGQKIVVRETGLATPSYQPANPLKPCAVYFWTVRAHFKLDGSTRVTEWTSAFGSTLDPRWVRRSSYPRFTDFKEWSILSRYLPFRTPPAEGEKCKD